MTLIMAPQSRGTTRTFQILDAAGNVITPGTNDRVRIRVGREGQSDRLTIVDNMPAAGGSNITKGATNTLALYAADVDFPAGVYTIFYEYYDNADAQWKEVDREPLAVMSTS